MTLTTPTPTPEPFANATSINSGFADATGLAPVVLLVGIAALGLVILTRVAPFLAEWRVFNRAFGAFSTSFIYALKGTGTLMIFGVVAAPVYYLATMDAGTRQIALKWVGYVLGGYVALVALGWLADRAVTRFFAAHPDYDGWGDILPDTDDDTPMEGEPASD